MFTLVMPETSLEFIDRFLLAAEAYHIPVILLINKIDLITGKSLTLLRSVTETYRNAGYACLEISVKTGNGIQEVIDALKDKTSLLAGNSGVGKSSLINRIFPVADLKTLDISASHKTGKHATTYAEMISLPNGGNMDKNEIGLYFTDIFRISRDCSFHNCTHIHEPGCAVRKALDNGILAQSRYQSYVNIFSDRNEKYRI
jgi:ribosome biogenesis GTPase